MSAARFRPLVAGGGWAFAAAFAVSALGHAAAARELGPEEVRAWVSRHFPSIRAAEWKAEAAGGELVAADGEFDTKLKSKLSDRFGEKIDYRYVETSLEKRLPYAGVTVFAGHRLGLGTIPEYTGKYETSRPGEVFAGASLPILRGRAIDEARNGRRVAETSREIAELDVRTKRNATVYKALSVYEKWRLAHEKRAIRAALLQLAADRQSALERRVHSGDVEKLKLVDNRRSIDKRREEWLVADLEVAQASAALGIYFRAPGAAAEPLEGFTPAASPPAPAIPPAPLDRAALPQFRAIEREIAVARANEALGANLRLPALSLEGAAFRNLGTRTGVEPQRFQLGVQLEFAFENRKGSGKEASARAKALALESERAAMELEYDVRVEQARAAVRAAGERIAALEREVQGAKSLVEAERRRWFHGDSDLYIVMLREQDAADAEVKLRTAHYDFRQAGLEARWLAAEFADGTPGVGDAEASRASEDAEASRLQSERPAAAPDAQAHWKL